LNGSTFIACFPIVLAVSRRRHGAWASIAARCNASCRKKRQNDELLPSAEPLGTLPVLTRIDAVGTSRPSFPISSLAGGCKCHVRDRFGIVVGSPWWSTRC